MVMIPAGSFEMGSPENEQARRSTEGPQHKVNVPASFAAGKFEVTFDEWDACVRNGGCAHNPADLGWGRGKRPVINVSWNDAQQYVQWLSTRTRKTYRLLSEAEWEYVARAGTKTPFNTGANINPKQASYDTSLSFAGSVTATARYGTVPVGSFQGNAFGLYDVHGNVWEWTEDCWNEDYVGAPSDASARITGDCGSRAIRGGSWINRPQLARSAVRNGYSPLNRINDLGFRVARALSP
jgi:formylglycine-generating enzyme required for sulfatase activity